ncbi:MAG: TRAP transporter large permease [Tissierellia bacterium]|nr:TRAP transporter large permease [Tissierellia bacterium]
MQTTIAICLLILLFFILLFMRVPVALSIAISSIVTSLYLDLPIQMVFQNMISGINSYSLMAIPFFILMGDIMSKGGIARRLINLANATVGWMKGGIAMVTVLASMLFGAVSGSSTACTATLGPIMVPEMHKKGYDKNFATDITMGASVTGLLIPPSHNMVIYSMVAGGVSVGALFIAGILPGIVLGLAFMLYSYFIAKKRNYPVGDKFKFSVFLKVFLDALWGLFAIIIVVVGVTTGVITATESAAIACLWSLIVSLVIYKEMKLKDISSILLNSAKTISMIVLLIASSNAFGWLLAYLKVPALVSSLIYKISTNPYIILIMVNILLLILGTLMDMSPIILIATPIILPIVKSLGMDPIQFGVVLILNLGIGLLTPPVGATLFLGSAVSGIKFEKLAKSMLPIYIIMIIVLLLVTFIPQISLFLASFAS